MKRRLLTTTLATLFAMLAWCADGDVFTVKTVEGIDMTFKVISESERTCQVGNDKLAIPSNTEGIVTIPESANGYQVTAIGKNAF